jgi:signal transduction histidine kinase
VKAIKMSAFAATMFLAFAVSILSIAWNLLLKNHLKTSSLGLSIPIGICFLTISLALWYAVRSQDQIFREKTIERESNFVVSNIQYYLDETAQEVVRMTKRWEYHHGTPEQEWLSDAQIALEHQPSLETIEIIDKGLKSQWKVDQKNLPEKRNLKKIPSEILEKDKSETSFSVYLSKEAPQDYVIWVLNPIVINNEFQGYITAGINVARMIDEIYHYSNNTLKEIEIRDPKGNLLFEKNPEVNFDSFPIQNLAHFNFKGINWIITAVFDDSTFSAVSYIPGITLFLGFLMSGLVLVAFYYSHQSQIKAKELEDSLGKLVQTQDRLMTQEKLASLGGLTAGIAHEIKNPLNFINNFSQLSIDVTGDIKGEIDKCANSIPRENYVEIADLMNSLNINLKSISDQGRKAQNTIARILAQSRGKTGARTLTDLHSLIEEYITLSYHGMRSQDPTFNTKFDKQFDSRIEKVEIQAEDFSRVLLNLLNNSYYALIEKKKMGGETFRPEVQIITKHLGDRIEITIHDNGTGIPEEARQKLFTPFYTTKPVGYGTGLGLSISYEIIVQGHGGILKCESKEGDYTNFIIQIPVNMNSPLNATVKRAEEEVLNLT